MRYNREILRGDVYWYDPPELTGGGSIQQKMRPVVIVSNNICNSNSPILSGRYTTSQINKHDIPTHIKAYINNKLNIIICEQEVPVVKSRLKRYICSLDEFTIYKIEYALLTQYGIFPEDHVSRLEYNIHNIDRFDGLQMLRYCEYYETHSFEDTCVYYGISDFNASKKYIQFCNKLGRKQKKEEEKS